MSGLVLAPRSARLSRSDREIRANEATAGAIALAGLFGPLVDLTNAVLRASAYYIAFGLAARVTLNSQLPLAQTARGEVCTCE